MGVGRPGSGITSPVKIIANIFVSFIGAGMLGLPFAFKESGIMEGAVIMALVGYLSVAAMLMLIDCKYAILSSGGRAGGRSIIMDTKVPLIPPDSSDDEDEDERHPPTPSTDLTYGDVGLYALGPGGKRLVDITIVISQIGFCCGYLIYLCKNLNMYVPRISQRLWLMLILPPLYSLTLLRHLNKLAVFSLFAQVSNVFALAVVFWFDFSHSEEVPFQPKEFSIKGFPFFFAVAIYCYEGAGMILSLEESVAEHMREKFRSVFVCTMTGLTTLYICFGVSGYASFGPHTMDIITLNLPHGGGSVDFAAMVKICLGVALFFTYPMMMFPVTHLLDKTFGFNASPYRGNIMRLVLVGMTGLVVIAVPNFAILMSLIGATCCTLLAFILPAAFHLSIFKQRLTKRQWYFDMMLIMLGISGSVIGLWDALNRMNEGHPLDVNEFSPSTAKNGSLHTAHLTTASTHRSVLEKVSSSVLANITSAEANYEKNTSTGLSSANSVGGSKVTSVDDKKVNEGKKKSSQSLNASGLVHTSPGIPVVEPSSLPFSAVAAALTQETKTNPLPSSDSSTQASNKVLKKGSEVVDTKTKVDGSTVKTKPTESDSNPSKSATENSKDIENADSKTPSAVSVQVVTTSSTSEKSQGTSGSVLAVNKT